MTFDTRNVDRRDLAHNHYDFGVRVWRNERWEVIGSRRPSPDSPLALISTVDGVSCPAPPVTSLSTVDAVVCEVSPVVSAVSAAGVDVAHVGVGVAAPVNSRLKIFFA